MQSPKVWKINLVVLLAHCLNPSKALLSLSGEDPPIANDLLDEPEPLGVRQLQQIQHRLPVEQIMELVRQYETGASASELARTFGINETTVYGHLKRQGARSRPYRKLRGEQFEEAIRLLEAGMSVRGIARELGLNRQTVTRALHERDC